METELGNNPALWEIAVNAPLRDTFTYKADKDLNLQPGHAVRIPFGPKNREVAGLVVAESKNPNPQFEAKNILKTDEERPPLDDNFLKWLTWISKYYLYPLGQIHQLAYPPLKKESKRKSKKAPVVPEVDAIEPLELNAEQKNVVDNVDLTSSDTYLLRGVTGSGKTEVYIELIQKVLNQGKTALVLVPEISLTPQLVKRFAQRFQDEVAVIHSHLTDREKTNQWWSVIDKKKRLLIGARSALFCPIPDLGIIVIDEEHETSFKQEEKLKYNARDIAIVRSKLENYPVILGSATPSLESWQNVIDGKYNLLELNKRVSSRPLPEVKIINPREDRLESEDLPYWLSKSLYLELKNAYEKNQQSALFLNRRGIAPNVQCYDCGFSYMCPNCDISLTLHGSHHLVCHYCGYFDRLSNSCPSCSDGEPKAYGLGTEAVEKEILKLFPESRVFRADRDEINSREALEEMVEKMENNEIDFLVGTQMIAKGLDFKNLTLVGIVHADVAFNVPDFRASERGFQLCTQVSGRAGRHEQPGKVIIQTYKTNHPSLLAAQKHDFLKFAADELEHRKIFSYPPFGKLTSIRISGLRENEVIHEANAVVNYLNELKNRYDNLSEVSVLGPTPAPLSRIKNRYRYHILLKGPEHNQLNYFANQAESFIAAHCKKSKFHIDVDPYSLI